LGLTPKEAGTIVAVGLGTATVAFLDLVGYLLRMNVHTEALKKGLDLRLVGNEIFEWFLNPTFKLIFLVSVKLQDEVIGYELCEKLTHFNREHGLHNFEYRLRVSSTTPKRWDAEYLRAVFDPKDVTHVFIGSISGAEEPITKLFVDAGVPHQLVTIV
jgi:hypothetical protein